MTTTVLGQFEDEFKEGRQTFNELLKRTKKTRGLRGEQELNDFEIAMLARIRLLEQNVSTLIKEAKAQNDLDDFVEEREPDVFDDLVDEARDVQDDDEDEETEED